MEGAFKHIAMVTDDGHVEFLTSGLYDVLEIYNKFTDNSGTYV